jgi:NADH dehydrogenase
VAPGLKSIDDATLIRRRILLAFERAEMLEEHESERSARERLLRFVIVGGGPTGVELAGTIAELAHYTLAADFRRIDPRSARVVLVEAGDRILPTFDARSSAYALQALRRLGVEVLTGVRVTACSEQGVEVQEPGGSRLITAATVIWAAGVEASPVGNWLGVPTDRSGRIAVAADLSVPGHDNIFVIGDAALARDRNGNPVPGIAPAAKQEGRYIGKLLTARLDGNRPVAAFTYRHGGNLATIGRTSAVIEFPRLHLRGRLAWWVWGAAHIYFLLGVRSPLLISLRWLWEYLTFSRGARLITGAVDLE